MKKIFIISLCCILALSCVAIPVTVYAAGYALPWDDGDTVYISYQSADYAPFGDVTAFGALMYMSELSGVDIATLVRGYSWYQVVSEKVIVARAKFGECNQGYILWKDSSGDYQHYNWTLETTDTVLDEDIDTTSAAPAELTGEEFADIVSRLNEQYMPYEADTITMLTDKRWGASNAYADSHTHHNKISLYTEGYFAGNSNWTEIYMQPFYFDGSDYWVSSSQIHLFQEVSQDDSGNNVITMYHEEYSMFDSFDSEGNVTEPLGKRVVEVRNQNDVAENFATYRYFDIQMNFNEYANAIILDMYTSNSNYVSRYVTGSTPTAQIRYYGNTTNDLGIVRKVSDLENGVFDNYVKLETVIQYLNPSNSSYLADADIGFFVSNELIKNGTYVVPEKIDPEATVKMIGDTIYDYTITNTTGDTMTFNEYVTNNYTYITNNGGDDGGSSGGSLSGDVNVKGEIAVGGQVDVNVNVNTDSDTSSDFLLPADQYAEYLPEVAPEVTEYLEVTYSFLPPEVVGLLIGGIGAAVLCRILGR